MVTPDKVFVCVVFHHSELRPEGLQMAENFCKAWKDSNMNYQLVVLDNESTCGYNCLKSIPHHFIRIDNQVEHEGITGAWNTLCEYAYRQGAEIITGFADDVQLNNSFQDYIEAIQDTNTVYAPITDGMMMTWGFQKAKEIRPGYRYKSTTLNGFWLGFTREFYEQKAINQKLFDINDPHIGYWHGQEHMLQVWNKKHGTIGEVIGDCWIHHTKVRSWKRAREKFNN